jgi:DNA-binding NarL/FixJ family response regulator
MSRPEHKILVADDHELIRGGLRRLLLESGTAPEIGEASTAAQTMDLVRRERWSLVILDLNLPGRSGMEVLKQIKVEFPALPVLILSTYPEEEFAVRAIRGGAAGYLHKGVASRVLVEAIRQVLATGQFISPKVAEQLVKAVKHPSERPLHAALSDREDQVLRQIAEGRTVSEIAAALSLSVKTVSTYRSIVLRKLGLENNAQLMRYALEHHLAR